MQTRDDVEGFFELKTRQVYFIYPFPRQLCKPATTNNFQPVTHGSLITIMYRHLPSDRHQRHHEFCSYTIRSCIILPLA